MDFNLDRLQTEITEILEANPLHREHRQLCLNHTPDSPDPWYEGVASLNFRWSPGGRSEGSSPLTEADFSRFHDSLSETHLLEVLEEFQKFYDLGRVRLMGLEPQRCLSWHVDSEERLHIPIFTNPQCFFLVGDRSFHLPSDNRVYLVNTLLPHSAVNCSQHPRLHLVANIRGYKSSSSPSLINQQPREFVRTRFLSGGYESLTDDLQLRIKKLNALEAGS